MLLLEVIRHYCPRIVDANIISAAVRYQDKINNWNLLNEKVLKKLGIRLNELDIINIVKFTPKSVDKVLQQCQLQIIKFLKNSRSDKFSRELPAFKEKEKSIHHLRLPKIKSSELLNHQEPIKQNAKPNHKDSSILDIIHSKNEQIKDMQDTIDILTFKI